jgi:RNA polymerase sigma-70 factor (ECF subfamily)
MSGPEPTPSFEQVYRAHVRFVWRSLRRLGVPECDAFDAAQQVFMVVHRRLGEFEGRSSVARWLFAIAVRVASDRRRSARVRHEVLDGGLAAERAAEQSDGGEQAARREALERLEQVLDTLPMEQRAVFVLFELEGMSGAEIAEVVDAPVATVHSRLRLAREAFRKTAARLRAAERFDELRTGGQA